MVVALQQLPTKPAVAEEPERCTLLELVEAVSEVTDDDEEVVATVLHMLKNGSVALTGNFRSEPIESFLSAD